MRLRCSRCFSIVDPSEATCGGCGASFTPEQIREALDERLCQADEEDNKMKGTV